MKNIFKALASFQQSCPVILKDTQGFGYTYADLPDIYKVIMPLLKDNGLGFTQVLKDKGLETILFHIESGETISGYVEIPSDVTLAKMNQYQVMGSAYSYFRRYALSSMLGIVTDKDTDASTPADKPATPVKTYTKPAQPIPAKPTIEDQKKLMIIDLCKKLGFVGKTASDYGTYTLSQTTYTLEPKNFDSIIAALEEILNNL